jgi:EAL domain-containing protein (putative c-di-GMP-specific phosphodiesterase class I)
MSKDTNIIDLLSDTIARRFPRRFQTSTTESEATDLWARRRPDTSDDDALSTEHLPSEMSPGEVWEAVSDDCLVVHYQPQYDMLTGTTVAAEALVRLVDADGQLVYPNRFIAAVEDRDLIVPLGRAVIEQVCADLATCRAEGLYLQRVAVNLSAHQLIADTGLLGFIDLTLARHGLRHTDLEFELTERHSLQADCDGHTVLHALAQRGARIVIDDFGAGYSSVIYLTELPVAAFKLDRSLVARVLEDTAARKLVDSLLALANNMDLDVVAEGVETKAQRDHLATAGCPLAQGYDYARPMPVDELKKLVTDENARTEYSSVGA